MLLIELATQNVKGFSPSSRASLRPGYNVIIPPHGATPGLLAVFQVLFYNDGSGADAALATGPQARAGLTSQGTDSRIYRLVRGLGGSAALHRLEQGNQWAVVAQENADIGRHLRGSLGVPSREAFELLFSFSPQSLPSRRRAAEGRSSLPEKPAAVAGPDISGRSIRSTALVEAALAASRSSKDTKDRIEALKAEMATGKALEEEQYKIEGMQQRLFQLGEAIKKIDAFSKKAESIMEVLAKLKSPEALGLDAEALQRAARYDEGVKKLNDQLAKLSQEDQFAQDTSGLGRVAPLYRDQAFLAGAGAGLASMACGIALRTHHAGAVALLSIPAFGYAGLCALRWIGKLQRVDSLERRQNVTRDREQKLYSAFDSEFLLIKGAMKVIDVENGKEFIEYFKERQHQVDELSAVQQRLTEEQGSLDFAQAVAEHEQLSREAKALEAKISESGAGVSRDWREAERELQDLEGEAGPGAEALVAVGGSFEQPGESKDDPIPRLLAAAQELFAGASVQSLGAAMKERASQYVTALTDKRYSAVEIDARGAAQQVAPGRVVPAGQLDDLDLDMLYIAVKLTIVERYAPLGKPVLVLDEPFLGFDDNKLALLSRMLKHIGTQTQVLHATALPAHHGLADATHSA